ncbi:efflux RND transporter permease subunit [Pararhizobium arenae]|uniref:efflux RND transporter permease subunit n=1 Tax=Pararhizobium arenae TaxID=1856850 RepID=UPI00094B75AD|nr:efflux RND transporter permease subunit [Pararhizobium arenae]
MKANISAWAIRNPLPSILLFVILTVVGLYSFSRLPVTYFPTIITPTVKVTVEQSGTTPTELETEVTRPVEDAIASLPGIDELTSSVVQGVSVTTVEFELGVVSPDRAIADVRDVVAKIRSDLPADIDEPVIERVEEEAQSVVSYAVTGKGMSWAELSWFIEDVVARDLQGVAGVGRVDRIGGVDREIQVELDAAQMQSLSLTAAAATQALFRTQVERSGGRTQLSEREQGVSTMAAARSAADLADLHIPLPDNRSVRLGDLGHVRDTVAEPRSFATFDGADVVGFSVYRTQGASDVSVAAGVAQAIEDLEAKHTGVGFRLVEDNVAYTIGNYRSAMQTLIEGAALAVVIVFIFLRDWRATLVAAVALPLSVIPTFFVIAHLGFSLNILSLLAITLVTGILVDDAIVEIENVVRHRNMGKSAYRAALDASDEIGLAVIAISATIIAVFVPVGTMTGVVGLYFREFGLTVAIAVFFSLVVARLITPIMAAYLMKGHAASSEKLGRVASAYERLLQVSLRWRWTTAGISIGVFVAAVMIIASSPTGFLPDEDNGRLTLTVELPPGSTLDDTRAVTDEIAKRLGQDEDVEGVFARAGSSMGGQSDVRYAVMLVDLTHKSERKRSLSEMESDLDVRLASLPDAKMRFLNSRGARDLSFAVLGSDGAAVEAAANAIVEALSADSDFIDPTADGALTSPQLTMDVMADKAASFGVSPAAVAEAIRVSTVGDVDDRLPKLIEGSRQIPIRLLLDRSQRDDLAILQNLSVASDTGASVPLSAVATFSFGETISFIDRFDRQRRIEIGADMANGLTPGQGLERLDTLAPVKNLASGVTLQATGDSDSEGDVFESFIVAMVAGIMLVLCVLILLFGNVLAPFTILASLPLAIAGVAAALFISGGAVSLPVVIGILMLMGIVTKNAIMLIDFAIEREREGLSRVEAIRRACLERARPIVMTTLAMVGGMLPSAIGVGDGGEFRSPMAITVIGGLLVSTVLSLLVIPALHLIVSGFGDRIRRVTRTFFDVREREVA